MGFWQALVESYDKNEDTIVKIYPLSTTSISNNDDKIVVVKIDENGKYLGSDEIDKRSGSSKCGFDSDLVAITIPVTEESMGRSRGISPHPVFDQFEYLKGSGEKYEKYIKELEQLASSEFATMQIKAIYAYEQGGTLETDILSRAPKEKTMILFKVEIPGIAETKVWKDPSFFNAWHQYYLNKKQECAETTAEEKRKIESSPNKSAGDKKRIADLSKIKEAITLDYLSGENNTAIATFHPKKISNASANSKLVSANDATNYTYRGKFEDASQAVAVGYESSQKAHQFLRYLINDRAYSCGEQIILSFTIGALGEEIAPPIMEKSYSAMMMASIVKTERDNETELLAKTGIDFANALRNSLASLTHSDAMKNHEKTAVVAFDAATTGRLSITFYRELERNEYIEKIAIWHDSCKWNQYFWDDENSRYVPYTGAPSIDSIIEAVYGKQRSLKDESYTKIKKNARERLLRCIFDGAQVPEDYVTMATRRASNPLGITTNGKFDRNAFSKVLSTACALIRKQQRHKKKEDYTLSIELDRNDRDYLYGRLLGAVDKLEEYALKKQGSDRIVTAAIRHMQTFAQHPFRTWQTIHECLNPYIQRVKGSFAFTEIQNIKQLFQFREYENDKPLNGTYLIGYYHERAYIEKLVKNAGNKNKTIESVEKGD